MLVAAPPVPNVPLNGQVSSKSIHESSRETGVMPTSRDFFGLNECNGDLALTVNPLERS